MNAAALNANATTIVIDAAVSAAVVAACFC